MVPSLPLASVFGVVTTVAAVALLVGIAARLVRSFRDRGTPGRPEVSDLERAQLAAITLAAVGLAAGALVDSEVAPAAMTVGVVVAAALAVVRWRRGEPPFPTRL